MAQRILNVKVRPFRVAVLFGKTASDDEVLLALKFLSFLWGGRYCQLLAVEPCSDDPVALSRLYQSRPDLVYGIGIDLDAWCSRVRAACQPRGFGPLVDKYVNNLHESVEEHVTARHVIHRMQRTPIAAVRQQPVFRVIGCDPNSPLRGYVAAMFGIPYENLGSDIPHESGWFPETGSVADMIALNTDVISKFSRSWLDMANSGFTLSNPLGTSPPPPTIVLVESLPADLALFWELRQGATWFIPPWVIPIPADAIADPAVIGRIADWLKILESRCRCVTCRVTSKSVSLERLHDFAVRLQEEVKGTMVTGFHAWQPLNGNPYMIAYDSEQRLTVELTKRTLTFHPPKLNLLEGSRKGRWLVELCQDVRTGRAVRELCIPSRASTFTVLNAPSPTSIPMAQIRRLGVGLDGIDVLCHEPNESVKIYLPTAMEILTEVLHDAGITPTEDEKRACYLPVLRMFGGLNKIAEAFSGQRGDVLRCLLNGPLHFGEIQQKARLGKGKLAELAEPDVPSWKTDHLDPIAKRIFRQRRRRLWTRMSPSTTAVESLLEFWADRGVLSRQWQLGPCIACKGSFWERHLDITRPVPCPGCGRRLRLRPQVPMGYSIHRLVGQAIQQGIVPVVLAGRFLKNLTHRGFFWLPGVKYTWDGKKGDLDVLACCDSHIVVGECKKFVDPEAEPDFWGKLIDQFASTIEVSKAIKAGIVFLAVTTENYPVDFQEKVAKLVGSSMKCLFLNRQDLEQGERLVVAEADGQSWPLSLHDLLVDQITRLNS